MRTRFTTGARGEELMFFKKRPAQAPAAPARLSLMQARAEAERASGVVRFDLVTDDGARRRCRWEDAHLGVFRIGQSDSVILAQALNPSCEGGHLWVENQEVSAATADEPGWQPPMDIWTLFHVAWSKATGTPGYDKNAWKMVEAALKEAEQEISG